MRRHRVPIAVFGAVIALAIAAVGSYYGLVAQDDGSTRHWLPQYADGATNLMVTQAYIGQPDDFSAELKRSDIVVEGVIQQLYPSQWTTEDGAAPDELTKEVMRNLSVHIRTPVELAVKTVFKGDSVGDTLKFSFVGGRVGDTAHVYKWNNTFEKGTRVIVFLGKGGVGSAAHKVEAQGLYPRMHLVVKGGVVQGPLKDVPLEEVLSQLQ